MMAPGVTVVIPTIPPRRMMLERAVDSVRRQTLQPARTIIRVDHRKRGAGPTRTNGLRAVQTEWVAFLDDDDWFYPQHLQRLMETAHATGADLVYPWFDVISGTDPFPQFEGKPWDPENPHLFPICFLVRTEIAQQAEFPPAPTGETSPHWGGDDWPFLCKIFELGAKVVHLNERTWAYNHHGANTSGLPARWK